MCYIKQGRHGLVLYSRSMPYLWVWRLLNKKIMNIFLLMFMISQLLTQHLPNPFLSPFSKFLYLRVLKSFQRRFFCLFTFNLSSV